MSRRRPAFPGALLWFWLERIGLMWGLIGAFIFGFQFVIAGIVSDNENIKIFLQMIDILPPFIKAMLGGEMLMAGNITAILLIGYQHPLILILYMIFAVGVPMSLLTGSVQSGTMELILSRSVRKTHVYYCVAGMTILGMVGLTLAMFAGSAIAVNVIELPDPANLSALFKAAVNGGMLAGTVGAIALLAAASLPKRGTAMTVTVIFLVLQYFTVFIGEWWPRLDFLQPYSLFYYVKTGLIVFKNAWQVYDMCMLVGVLMIAVIAGGFIWQRRDLRV